LVGVILTTERATSVAMTWAHPEFRVSAATEDGSVLGVVALAQTENSDEPLLELRGVPYRDTVAAGTLVVTTGLGGIYPNGVPIGRVLGVAREQKGWERIYLIRPAVNLGMVGHVLVLGRIEAGAAAFAAAAKPVAPPPVVTPQVTPPPATDSAPPRRRRPRPRTDSAPAAAAVPTKTDSTVRP
jgi:rod shape-determining protein MreC